MSKHATARLLTSALGDLTRNDFADSSQSEFAILPLSLYLLTIFRLSAFCNDDERAEITGSVARFDRSCNSVVIKRELRHQNNINTAAASTGQCDPAGMT